MLYDIKIDDGNCYFNETINVLGGIALRSISYRISIYFNGQEYNEELCIERDDSGKIYKVWLSINEGDESIKEKCNGFQYDYFGEPCLVAPINYNSMTADSITDKIKRLVTKYQNILKQSGY